MCVCVCVRVCVCACVRVRAFVCRACFAAGISVHTHMNQVVCARLDGAVIPAPSEASSPPNVSRFRIDDLCVRVLGGEGGGAESKGGETDGQNDRQATRHAACARV